MSTSSYLARHLAALAGLVAVVAAQDAAAPPGPVPRLVLHFDDPVFEARAAKAIAEVWALAGRCMDLSGSAKASLHVHNDAVACQEIAKRHEQPHTQSSPGFVVAKGDVAHVLFHRASWCRDARWRVGNLTMQLALRQAAAPVPGDWPGCFAGLAAFAEGPFRSAAGVVEPRHHVERSLPSLFVVRRLGARLPAAERLLREDFGDLQEHERTAAMRQLVVFLMTEHSEAAAAAFRSATAATDRGAACAALVVALRDSLGDEAFETLDAAWGRFRDGLPETLDLEFHPTPDAVGGPDDPDFVPASPAVTWLDRNSKSKFTLRAQPQLVQIGQADLVFERSKGRWVRVTFLAHTGRGHVLVSERIVADGAPSAGTCSPAPPTTSRRSASATRSTSW